MYHSENWRRHFLASHKILVPLCPNQMVYKRQVSLVAQKGKKKTQTYLLEFLKQRSWPRSGRLCWKGCARVWSWGCRRPAGLSAGFLLLHRPLSSPFACRDTFGSSLLFAPRGANIRIEPFSCKIQNIPGLPVPAGSLHAFLHVDTGTHTSLPWPLMVADGLVPDFHFHNALLRVSASWVADGITPPFRGSHFIDTTACLSLCPQNPEAGGSGYRDRQLGASRCYSQFGQLEINTIQPIFN